MEPCFAEASEDKALIMQADDTPSEADFNVGGEGRSVICVEWNYYKNPQKPFCFLD